MAERNFFQLLRANWQQGKFVCVGLDTEFGKIRPRDVRKASEGATVLAFNRAIVDATHELVCAYKPNIAFYEALGPEGWSTLHETIVHIHRIAPQVPVILDAKRADIGTTNAAYAKAAFHYLEADAITVHPYLGREALQPFLDVKDKGIFVLCRTSNPGAGELQDQEIRADRPLYQFLASSVANTWNSNGNCGLVVGATYPQELKLVRESVGDMPLLIPGIGAQGGDLEASVAAGKDSRGEGMIINSSRGIIYAYEKQEYSGVPFDEAARLETDKLHQQIRAALAA